MTDHPIPPNGDLNFELLSQHASEECGCPEETWLMGNVEVTLHMEEDGSGHILLDAGDWEYDWETAHEGMADLRQKAADYICALPRE